MRTKYRLLIFTLFLLVPNSGKLKAQFPNMRNRRSIVHSLTSNVPLVPQEITHVTRTYEARPKVDKRTELVDDFRKRARVVISDFTKILTRNEKREVTHSILKDEGVGSLESWRYWDDIYDKEPKSFVTDILNNLVKKNSKLINGALDRLLYERRKEKSKFAEFVNKLKVLHKEYQNLPNFAE